MIIQPERLDHISRRETSDFFNNLIEDLCAGGVGFSVLGVFARPLPASSVIDALSRLQRIPQCLFIGRAAIGGMAGDQAMRRMRIVCWNRVAG